MEFPAFLDFMAAHWHCLLPLVGIAAYLLAKRAPEPENKGGNLSETRI
jgi:hypothetical protein